MTVTSEWITMASALGFGGGRSIIWQDEETVVLPADPGESRPVLAIELEGRISPERLKIILADRQRLAAGLLVKVDGPAQARMLLRQGGQLVEVIAYGVLADYYTSHIPFGVAGEATILRYCLGLRRDPGGRAAVKSMIKSLLTFLGLGQLLYEYCLVYLERSDDDS